MKLLRSSVRIELPESPARNGWRINPGLLLEALDYLQIRRLVSIRYSAGYYRVGTHYARKAGFHRIVISQDRGIDESEDTLWHELAHACQAEAWELSGGKFHRFYREAYVYGKGEWGASYKNNRYEIKARNLASNAPFDILEVVTK